MPWMRKRSRPEPQPLPEVPPGPPAARLHDWFARNGIAIAPASQEAVAALEARHEVRLPEDFRAYLLAAGPAGENMDDVGIKWWPLAEIGSVPEGLGAADRPQPKYLLVADYLVWCYAWAIACTEDANHGRVTLVGGGPGFVADSFTEFVDLCLVDDPRIHGNNRP